MGLDDFRTDDVSEDEENDKDNDDDEYRKNEDENQEVEEEEAPTDNGEAEGMSGLEAFESDNYYDDNGEQEEESGAPSWAEDITPERWNEMEERERVVHVRARHISDFRPEVQVDKSWSWTRAIELKCICGETFTFESTGMCLSCGRVYEKDGRIVKLTEEPQE